MAFRFRSQVSHAVVVSVYYHDNGGGGAQSNLDLFVIEGDVCDAGRCFISSTDGDWDVDETLAFVASPEQTFYLVVDTPDFSLASGSLHVDCFDL
jgi:hypothetical protein